MVTWLFTYYDVSVLLGTNRPYRGASPFYDELTPGTVIIRIRVRSA